MLPEAASGLGGKDMPSIAALIVILGNHVLAAWYTPATKFLSEPSGPKKRATGTSFLRRFFPGIVVQSERLCVCKRISGKKGEGETNGAKVSEENMLVVKKRHGVMAKKERLWFAEKEEKRAPLLQEKHHLKHSESYPKIPPLNYSTILKGSYILHFESLLWITCVSRHDGSCNSNFETDLVRPFSSKSGTKLQPPWVR